MMNPGATPIVRIRPSNVGTGTPESSYGDLSSNTSVSVNGEVVLFSGTTGKLVKRATTTGILKGTSGVLSAATVGTDYYGPGMSVDLPVSEGGTGASDASGARTNLGLVIGTDIQAFLVSGTNIKTINGSSLLGAGDLVISGGSGTPGGSDTQVQFNDGGSFGGDAGLTYNKTTDTLSMLGKLSVSIPNNKNTNALDITQGDTTNNPIAAIISNSGTAQALKIIQNGNTSTSTSTGGAILLDTTNSNGAGLVIYSNQANPSGRLMNIRADNSSFDQAALHIDYDGTRNAVEIVANSVTDDAVPLTVTNTNWTASTIGVSSDVENHGSYKSIHTFPSAGVGASGSDAVASHISLDSQGVGTAVQGIFMTSTTTGGGTSGKLLNLRNRVQSIGDVETELLTLTGSGFLGLSSATPGAVLDIGYANLTGATTESLLFRSKSQTITLSSGTTIANFRQNQFLAPTINGVAGGGTETVTNSATVYIDNAPSGSNITLTNSYALLVNAGDSKFGGQVTATVFRSSSSGLVNNSSGNNATIDPASTGTTIKRNIADTSPTLIVQQLHASSTGDILQLKNNASTVLTVSQAGVLSLSGVVVPSISSTNTLTNKRNTRRLTTTNAPGATPTTNTDNVDVMNFTGLNAAITSMTTNLSGTPVDGDLLEFRFTDDGTARGITWGASFAATTVALPTTTVISTMLRVGFEYSGSTWKCVATC